MAGFTATKIHGLILATKMHKEKKERVIELFCCLFYNLYKMKPVQIFRRDFIFLFFIFILLFKTGIGLQSKSPVYHVEHLTIDDGLSQSSVNCILQDSTGFLWFGTQDGLNRYDGYEFKVFKNLPFDNNSLSQNSERGQSKKSLIMTNST